MDGKCIHGNPLGRMDELGDAETVSIKVTLPKPLYERMVYSLAFMSSDASRARACIVPGLFQLERLLAGECATTETLDELPRARDITPPPDGCDPSNPNKRSYKSVLECEKPDNGGSDPATPDKNESPN